MSRDEGGRGETLRVRAPAKINLFLEVLARRRDGYHEIRTVMQAVSLYDELGFTLRADGEVALRGSGPDLPPAEDNLVVRAARLVQRKLGCRRGVEIRLSKSIPVGRGFGGGSSDCAATLRALNELWRLALGLKELEGLAAQLGSDVPFFLHGGSALCEGRGERVRPLPARGKFHYVLLVPPDPISSREAYEAAPALTRGGQGGSITAVQLALATGDVRRLGEGLHNALQAPAFRLSPDTRRIADMLEDALPPTGCRGHCLTGSGSGFFGVFDGGGEAREAALKLERELDVPALAVESVRGIEQYFC